MIDFLIVIPPIGKYQRGEDRCQVPIEEMLATSYRMPINAAYMSAVLKQKGFKVKIRDYPAENKSIYESLEEINKLKPKHIIIITNPFVISQDHEYVKKIKNTLKDVKVIGVGVEFIHEPCYYAKQYSSFDYIIYFDYIRVLLDYKDDFSKTPGVVYFMNKKCIKNEPTRQPYDFDSIIPDRDELRNELYIRPDKNVPITTIQTSLGCPFKCIYCLAPILTKEWYGKVIYRSPKSIAHEIELCIKKYNIKDFFLRADTFTLNKKQVLELTALLKPLHKKYKISYVVNSRVDTIDEDMIDALKESGCELIAFGIETGSEKTLIRIKKTSLKPQEYFSKARRIVNYARKKGIKTFLFFMIGFYWETKQDMLKTINFARELHGDYYEFHYPVPFPGTELWLQMKKFSWSHTDFKGTKYVSEDEMKRLLKKAIFLSYFNRTIFRKLKDVLQYPGAYKNYLYYGIKLIKKMLK